MLLKPGKRDARKRIIVLGASLFFGLLFIWTLFHNMVTGMTLPKVVTEKLTRGALDFSFQGAAVLRPVQEVELSNPSGGKPTEILVNEGDSVQEGQVLVKYDRAVPEQQIELEHHTLEKMRMSLDELQDDYKLTARGQDSEAIETARNALKMMQLDITAQEKRIQMLQTELAAQRELKAPFDGIVTAVNAIENLPSSGADIRILHTERGMQFAIQVPSEMAADLAEGEPIEVHILGKDKRLVEGRIAKIEAGGELGNSGITEGESEKRGSAIGEQVADNGMILHVRLQDKSLRAGARVQVQMTQRNDGHSFVLSSKAVHQDRNGFYVFTVQSKPGQLGNHFFAVKNIVTVTGKDDLRTAIASEFWDEDVSVIVESSEPLEDGQRIRF